MLPRLLPTTKSDPELAPFRPGLVFAFFNALAWQIGIGTPMVLFAEQLGASTFQVGLAYSFVFLLTPIQVVSTALIPRFGFKKVMLSGWRIRSFFLVVPVALTLLALRGVQPWMAGALVWSVFFFCLFRSIGAAAAVSWFYAILPGGARGRYFASDQFISGIGGVGTLLASAVLFVLLPVYYALLIQYGIALVGAQLSYYALCRLPDADKPAAISLGSVLRDTPRHLFAPTAFRRYLWLAVGYAVISSPIPPFAAYYLRVAPGMPAGQIMLFEVLRLLGVIAAAWLIRRRIDVTGAKPFFLLALGLHLVVGACWWFYLQNGAGGMPGLFAVYFLLGLGAVSWNVANLNYLPKVVPAAERTLVVSIHGAVTAFIGGLSPVVWGLFLKSGETTGPAINVGVFQWFFVSVMAGVFVLSPLVARLPEDAKAPVEPIMIGNAILRPFRAASYLVNLIDVQALRRTKPAESPPADATAKEG